MTERNASTTAAAVAVYRAAHLILDSPPLILDDSVMVRMLGPEAAERIRSAPELFQSEPARALRAHVVLRSRFAEDSLREAAERGIKQYVLLGAGLDTFAYRQPVWARELSIVEVDHPSSQSYKREMLAKAGVETPPNVRYADIDFEHETLVDGLRRHGVAFDQPTFFSWLGVTMYLTREAIDAVLRTVASFPKGSEIVLTFSQPRDPSNADDFSLPDRAAAVGEPWISYFTPDELRNLLLAHGFSSVFFLMRDDAFARYFDGRTDGLLPPRRTSIARAIV